MRGASIFAAPTVTITTPFPPTDLGRCEEELDSIQRVLDQRLTLLRSAIGLDRLDEDHHYELCKQLREVESSFRVVNLDLASASPDLLRANAALLAQVRRCGQQTRLLLGMMRDVWVPGCWLCVPKPYYGSSEVEQQCSLILQRVHTAIALARAPTTS